MATQHHGPGDGKGKIVTLSMPRITYPFAAVPNHIIRGGHGLTNIAVLTAMLSHGKTTCSMSTLARELGCDKKTILPAIRYWIERGPGEGIEIVSQDRLGCPTVYEINVHEMREPHPKTGQVEDVDKKGTSPENGSGGDPKTGDLPHPKTGHKEEPIKKNKEEEREEPVSRIPGRAKFTMDWISNLTDEEVREIAEYEEVTEAFVRLKVKSVIGHCKANGKRYVDYRAALGNFIRSDIEKNPDARRSKPKPEELQMHAEVARPRTPEEQARIEARLREVRESLSNKMSINKDVCQTK